MIFGVCISTFGKQFSDRGSKRKRFQHAMLEKYRVSVHYVIKLIDNSICYFTENKLRYSQTLQIWIIQTSTHSLSFIVPRTTRWYVTYDPPIIFNDFNMDYIVSFAYANDNSALSNWMQRAYNRNFTLYWSIHFQYCLSIRQRLNLTGDSS
jgi:hypothetical protein